MLLTKKLTDITGVDVENLVANRVREERHLDYKASLPGGGAADKNRFLADVSAFANGGGGNIVFGIEDERDEKGQSTGIPKEIVGIPVGTNIDAETLRLTSVVESGLDPSLVPKVEFSPPINTTKGQVLVLRVPKSWTAPHMVRDNWRFYVRHGAKNSPMDTTALRAAFFASPEWAERVRRFRDERLGRIVANETPVPMPDAERLVLHLVPFSASTYAAPVDLTVVTRTNPIGFRTGGINHYYNIDGLCVADGASAASYAQLFRNGSVEAVVLVGGGEDIVLGEVEDYVLEGTERYSKVIAEAGASLPVALVVSLVGVKGKRASSVQYSPQRRPALDRDVLLLPDQLLGAQDPDLKADLKGLFDVLWQAFGLKGSASYGANGSWTRRQ